jgi:hypothetical protein
VITLHTTQSSHSTVTLDPKSRLTIFLNYSFVIWDLVFANMSLEKDSTSSSWFHAVARYRAVRLRQEVRRVRHPNRRDPQQ